MPDDRALPNLKARLTIDTSDAQRAQAAVQQARSGIQGMIAEAKEAGDAARSAAVAQRAEAAEFAATFAKGGAGLGTQIGGAGDQATTATSKLRGLGAAASSMGDAFGGAAGEGTRLASVLAYGGIAGAAAIGLAKLVEFGEGLNRTRLSVQELHELASKSSPDAAKSFVVFGGDDVSAQLSDLSKQGASGVGTILNLRDAMKNAGGDTKLFDDALRNAEAASKNLQSTTQRGQAALDEWTGGAARAKEAADRLAESARRLEAATAGQASAGASLLTSQSSVVGAENRLREARERLANFGTQATGKSVREQRDEAAAVESASRRIVDAQQRIIDARQKVVDAQEALAHAGEHERLGVQDAQDAVDAAQRKVNASTPEERLPAQHALEDAQQKLVDAKRALDAAKPDAERALADAVRGVEDAMQSEADAHRNLADAQDRQAESNAKAKDSQKDYQSAVDDVTEAQLGLAAAQATQLDLLAQLAGRVDGPVSKLGNLKTALHAIADELDPNSELTQRVLMVLAALGGVDIPTIQIATPGHPFRTSARGGHLSAFEPSWVGDKFGMDRAELFVPDVPGTIVPTNPFELAAMRGRGGPQVVNNHRYEVMVVANTEPPERAIRRELERFAMQAGG